MVRINLHEIRQLIADKGIDFVIRGTVALIFCTFTGSGKTTSILNAIDAAGYRWLYCAPSHDIIEENLKRSGLRKFNYLHLEGRDRVCLREDMKLLASRGINISSFCEDCGFRDNACTYIRKQAEARTKKPNIAITHAHIQQWLPRFLNTPDGLDTIRDFYDIVIIDENPIKCFIHEKTVTRRDVGFFRDCLIESRQNPEIVNLVEMMYRDTLDYDQIRTINLSQLNAIGQNKNISRGIANLYQSGQIDHIPPNITPFLFEIFARINDSSLEHMMYYREGFLNLSYFKPDALDLRLKIIGLDGTANRPVWEHMLDTDAFEIFNIDYQYKNAYQLDGGRYPITSWRMKGSTIPARLCTFIDNIASKKKRHVLFVGTKAVNKIAAKLLTAKNIDYAVYYNLRSKNEFYKKCDTVVLGVEPNPPQEKINACVSLSGWEESIWRRIFREEEMLQAIGRLRQNIIIIEIDGSETIIRERMEVYILPSTGVGDDPKVIDKIHYSNLLPEATVLSKSNLTDMLDGVGGFQTKLLYENLILACCPTTIKEFTDTHNIGRRTTEKYFRYMIRHELIKRMKKKYDITGKGRNKLLIEEKEDRGIVKRCFSGSGKSSTVSSSHVNKVV